jgi:serine/threonine protein kinase
VPGYRLDRYELLCPVAQGGMASVWVARLRGKHGFEKLVAIKTILPHYAAEPRFRRMFLDEARIASAIEHVNIGQILDLGEQHSVLYLVMEWIDGDSLSKLERAIEKKDVALPIGLMLRVLSDVLSGLHAAHELCDAHGQPLGVVHRDVSPQNILISSKGQVKLIDFGVAKARDRLADETHSGVFKGKIHYMSPEQALGKTIDRRADLWAVGAMLYRMLTKRPPFEAENQLATLHLLTSGRAPDPLPSHVPKAVTAIVERALKHDPNDRYASAAEMRAAIEEAMKDPRLTATTQSLAQFVAAQMADRAEARKEAIALALKAAEERERITGLWQTNAESSSGESMDPNTPSVDIPVHVPGPTTSWNPVDPGTLETVALGPKKRPTWRRLLPFAAPAGVAVLAIVSIAIARASRDNDAADQRSAREEQRATPAAVVVPPTPEPRHEKDLAEEAKAVVPAEPAAGTSSAQRAVGKATAPSLKSKPSPVKGSSAPLSSPPRKSIDDGF